MRNLKALDLFCGAGGMTRGALDAGFDVLAGVDNWAPALETHAANFPHRTVAADLSTATSSFLLDATGLAPGDLDLLTGGPPCQGFSVQRIGADLDDRNVLVLRFAEHVIALQPRLFCMENVTGLLGKRGKPYLARFLSLVESAGYRTEVRRIDAVDFGVPQHRRRVLVLGARYDVSRLTGPEPNLLSPRLTVRDAIGDLPEPPADLSPTLGDPLHRRTRLSALNQRRIEMIPPGGGFEDLPENLRAACHRAGAARIGHRQVYGRLHPDQPAATITARFDSFTRGRFGHPWSPRNITLREGARLQGFGDEHQFVGTQENIAALIGNAIPPPLAYAFSAAARHTLEGGGGSVAAPTLFDPVAA
jgi:DNA (cytosine-5)-methyltransferase 1